MERIRAWLATTSQRWEAIRPYATAAFEAAAVDPEIRALLEAFVPGVGGLLARRRPPAHASGKGGKRPTWTGPRSVMGAGATSAAGGQRAGVRARFLEA